MRAGKTQEEVEERMRGLTDGESPAGGWLSKIELSTNVLAFDDALLLARALDTSVAYLAGEVEFSAAGWDQLLDSDKEELAAMIDVKLKNRHRD